MPAWTNAPGTAVQGLLSGQVAYAAGSKALGPATKMLIDHVAVAANVVTLTVTVVEGNTPAVGDLIFVYATSSNSGGLNTSTGIAIASVSITAATGKGTLTYAKSTANIGTTADTGYANSIPGETGDALTGSAQKLAAFAVNPAAGYGLTWSWSTPSAPSTIALQLEGAVDNVDAEFTIIGSSQTTTSGEVIATLPELVRFVRPNVTASSGGTNPTLVVRFLQS